MNPSQTNSSKDKKVLFQIPLPLPEEPQHYWIADKTEIIVFKKQDEFYVLSSLCPHMGAQMQHCDDSKSIQCPWHGLKFDVDKLTSEHHRYKKIQRFPCNVLENQLIIYER